MEIKAFVITIEGNLESEKASWNCIRSSKKFENDFEVFNFNAIIPSRVDEIMKRRKIKWDYPWEGSRLDFKSGLRQSAYATADPKKRIACFLSHYELWKLCADQDEAIIVLEHDAIFTRKVDLNLISDSKYDIIALNDPRGATRKSQQYYELVMKGSSLVTDVPKIDDDQIPQGLPGNSAYFLKPEGARKLLKLTKEHGAWPNDALMCRQLLPNKLGIVKKFCTKVQGTRSTTTL